MLREIVATSPFSTSKTNPAQITLNVQLCKNINKENLSAFGEKLFGNSAYVSNYFLCLYKIRVAIAYGFG